MKDESLSGKMHRCSTMIDGLHYLSFNTAIKLNKEFVKKVEIWYDDGEDQRSLRQFLIDEAGKDLI